MAPLACGGRRKRPAKFFWRSAWFGFQSINQSVKLNWILITFHVEIAALMPGVWLSFTTLRLVENDVSFAWLRPLGMHLLLVLLNIPYLLKSACIDHNSFACCFSLIFWKVWRHRCTLFYESKVFFLLYATKSWVLQRFNLLHVVVLQRSSQKLFW